MRKVTIIGAGSFGTALSRVLTQAGNEVRIWARETTVAVSINEEHRNNKYLKDFSLPETLRAYNDFTVCLKDCDMVVMATPSHTVRELAEEMKPHLSGNELIVSVAKGIEKDSFKTMTQVIAEVLGDVVNEDRIGLISGPSHAEEVADYKPTLVVAAANSKSTALAIQDTFMTPMFRVYINYDMIGVELSAAVKNIMALAAGIADGAEMGDNAKAALMTRGLHEMKRLGMEMGAMIDTFPGLAGMGDLIVTCTSQHSRNRYVGFKIGQGLKLDEIINNMEMIAEGVKTTESVYQLARKMNIEMPITEAVYQVLFEGMNPTDGLYSLMTRNPKEEISI